MRSKGKRTRNILLSLMFVALFAVVAIMVCDMAVYYDAKGKLYNNVDSIPHREVGLILCTSQVTTWDGTITPYFSNRIKAAEQLYKAGKIDWLVVSGNRHDRSPKGTDEPSAIRRILMEQGVDSAHIVLDYDGTDALNSLAKMRDVYHRDSIIVVSQKHHDERALYMAKNLGMNAIGYYVHNARASRWRNRAGEVLKRVKLVYEVNKGLKSSFEDADSIDITKPQPTDLVTDTTEIIMDSTEIITDTMEIITDTLVNEKNMVSVKDSVAKI